MKTVCILDTSIFLNLLNVPNKNQDKEQVIASYNDYVELGVTFILPMATIIETGNHIAQNGDGSTRRKTAQRFCQVIKGAFEGSAPYQPSEFASTAEIITWLELFPDLAMRNKSSSRVNEGTSFGDLSIIQEFEKTCRKSRMSEIFIWSLDSDLTQYRKWVN